MSVRQEKSIRRAMEMTYKKHYSKCFSGEIGRGEDCHLVASYGAIGTRNKVCGFPYSEAIIYAELLPFLYLEKERSFITLCDYAIWRELQEKTSDDTKERLEKYINEGLVKAMYDAQDQLKAILVYDVGIPWRMLINENSQEIWERILNNEE